MTDSAVKLYDGDGILRFAGRMVNGGSFNGGTITNPLAINVSGLGALSALVDGDQALIVDSSGLVTAGKGLHVAGTPGALLDVNDDTIDAANNMNITPRTHTKPSLTVQPTYDGTTVLLEIWNENGDTIFRVDENGSVHIPTGTAIVADL